MRNLHDTDNAERAEVRSLDDDMTRSEASNDIQIQEPLMIDGMQSLETLRTDDELLTRNDLQSVLATHVALYHAHVASESTTDICRRAKATGNSSARIVHNALIGASIRVRH